MNADANYVAGFNNEWVERFERFVGEYGVSKTLGGGPGQDVKPTRRNHCGAKRHVTWVNEMDLHTFAPVANGVRSNVQSKNSKL